MLPGPLATHLVTAGVTGFIVVHGWALLGAVWHYRVSARAGGQPPTLRGLCRHLLPPELLRSRWTRLDIAVYAIHPLFQLLVFQFVVALTVGVAAGVAGALGAVGWHPHLAQGLLWGGIFLLAGLAARDFASFYVHYLQHKIPLLWEFHKVHHAPETLIPPTTRRLHPLDELAGILAEAVFLGAVVGLQACSMDLPIGALIAAAATLYAVAGLLTFAPLRHSHIDLRLGAFERIVLSPAHHQIHHSVEVVHWDRNFGAILPIWDRLWGTFLEPQPRDTYRLGLPDGESELYASLGGVYATPLRRVWAQWRGTLGRGRAARIDGRARELRRILVDDLLRRLDAQEFDAFVAATLAASFRQIYLDRSIGRFGFCALGPHGGDFAFHVSTGDRPRLVAIGFRGCLGLTLVGEAGQPGLRIEVDAPASRRPVGRDAQALQAALTALPKLGG